MWLLIALACTRPPVDTDPTLDPVEPYDPIPLIEPRIGTGGPGAGVGSINPGATRPFGMVVAGPASRAASGAVGFYHCAGYYYDDTEISGFTHTAAEGMGVTDYGTVLVMPKRGWDPSYVADGARASSFTHDREWATPGYYAVDLQDDDIHAELAATIRGAHHRYGFEADPVVLFDLGHANGSDRVERGEIAVDLSTGRVRGFQNLLGAYSERFGGLKTWFEAQLDPKPVAAGTWTDAVPPTEGVLVAEGKEAGAWLAFPPGTTEVNLRLAISYVDAAGAAANLEAELADLDFEARRAEAEAAWRAELANVRVRGGTEEQRRIFHTALFHAYQMPRTFQDVDGRYRGIDGEPHEDPGFTYHTDFSLWDTFRTSHPWFTVARPDRARDFAASLVQMGRDGGSLPRWPLGHGYTGGMIGTPADQVLAETYLKGVEGWPVEEGWALAYKHATGPDHVGRSGIESYLERGYASVESVGAAASHTLEFAWSDAALADWAAAMGKSEDAARFEAQSGNWRNTWDPEQGFFFARYADGTFVQDDPNKWTPSFVEGNAWQYLWMVPYDVTGMIELQHGGDVDAWLARHDQFWADTYAEPDDIAADQWYWHGNEPDVHYAYLGALAGRPDASADPVRFVQRAKYRDDGYGLDGNDDGGTLSAWYLWSAIGVFPVAGTVDYAVSAPIFERAEIDVPGGTLVVRAPGVSDAGRFVSQAWLGDEPLDRAVLTHDEWLAAGEIVLEMTEAPAAWGEGR